MALPTASDNVFPKVILSMSSNDPAAPTDSSWKLYAKAGGIYARSSNAIVGAFGTGGGGMTNPMTTTGDVIYSSDNSGTPARLAAAASNSVLTSTGAGSAPVWSTLSGNGLPQFASVKRTAGDLTTSSTSFVDATSLTVTMTTGGHRCIVLFNGTTKSTVAGGNVAFDIAIDGTLQGGTYGLALVGQSASGGGGGASPVSITYLTPVLTAGSHTIKVQWRVDGSQTGTLFASSSVTPSILTVVETAFVS